MTAPTETASNESTGNPLSRPAVSRLVTCAILFGVWMLYLALLVTTRPEVATGPRLIAQGQAMFSIVDVVAKVDPKSPDVVIEEVLAGDPALKGQTVRVNNLRDCGDPRLREPQPDVTMPGSYLLLMLPDPLTPGTFLVSPQPPAPGFSRDIVSPRAYLATPDILGQYRQIAKPERKAKE